MKIKTSDYMRGIGTGILIGSLFSLIMCGFIYGNTLDAAEQLKRRAIQLKVGEYYVNKKMKLEFRFLTEYRKNELILKNE